jgi:hypothetical protein
VEQPAFAANGGWQPAFPMQFMPPQMMQGAHMQFPPPVQFNQHQFPMFQEQVRMQPNKSANMKKKQVMPGGNEKEGSQNSSTPMQQERSVGGPSRGVDNGLLFDQRLKDVVCYNCGEPCHFVGMCPKPKKCFMCGNGGHHMDKCQEWKK